MKKILYVHHATGWGGATNSLIELINNLDKNLYQTSVLLLNSNLKNYFLKNNIDCHVASSLFFRKFYQYFTHSEANYVKWYQISKFCKLALLWILSRYYFADKELERFNFDIIHLNSSVLTDWLAPSKRRGRVIIHIREPFRNGRIDPLSSFFRRQMHLYADKIIAISHDNAKRIGLSSKCSVVYNWASVPRKSIPISSYYSKRFLYLGGCAYIKGFYTLVDALAYLDDDIRIIFAGYYSKPSQKKTGKELLKMIIGKGKRKKLTVDRMRCHRKAVEIGLIHNVDKLLNDVCAVISPFSVPHFSRPVIEAFLYKKPVIASDVDGMDEIVYHNENGLLFEAKNAKALAQAINYIARNPQQAKKMGECGFETAISTFTDKNINEFIKIYNSLLM